MSENANNIINKLIRRMSPSGGMSSHLTASFRQHPFNCSLVSVGALLCVIAAYNRLQRRPGPDLDIDLDAYYGMVMFSDRYCYDTSHSNSEIENPFALLFSKQPVVLQRVVSAVLVLPTLLFNIFHYYTLPRGIYDWWNTIDDTVILGALPFPFMVPTLASIGVCGIVNLCHEYGGPIHAYTKHHITQMYLPVVDYTAPTLSQIEEAITFIEHHSCQGQRVYVHCKAGKGRSTTIVLCYLMQKHNLSSKQALQRIVRKRWKVSKYLWRRECVVEFARKHQLPMNK